MEAAVRRIPGLSGRLGRRCPSSAVPRCTSSGRTTTVWWRRSWRTRRRCASSLYQLFDHLPAPPLLHGLPTLWAAGHARRAAHRRGHRGVPAGALPPPGGLPELPGAQTLMQGAYLGAGLARFLPEGWIGPTPSPACSPSPPTATTPGPDAQRRRGPDEAGRGPGTADHSPAAGAGPRCGSTARRSAEEFFAAVLDQTGDGSLDWPDLAAMAREIAGRLDLDEPEETRSTTPSPAGAGAAGGSRHRRRRSDQRREAAAAVPSLAGPGPDQGRRGALLTSPT